MPIYCRVVLLALVALLSACASEVPQEESPVAIPDTYFSPVAEDVLIRAIGLVGTPYRYGGNTPASGFDCSGLIGFVYRDAGGISLPRSTREMSVMRVPLIPRHALQPGDQLSLVDPQALRHRPIGFFAQRKTALQRVDDAPLGGVNVDRGANLRHADRRRAGGRPRHRENSARRTA